jgi:hypothetical protein
MPMSLNKKRKNAIEYNKKFWFGLPQVFRSIKKEYDIKRYAYGIKTFEPIKTRLHREHIPTLLVI